MATSRDSVKKVSGNHIEFRPIQSQAGIGLHSRGTSFNGCCSVYKGANGSLPNNKKVKVVFVLGGPGSGKGTQCANIVEHFGYTHLSAGDLLRAEVKSGSKNGIMIQRMIKEGKIVPSKVTIALLQRAIQETENDKFLIDGFPRNEENREAFERITGIQPDFVLFFDCTEEEMQRRLLNRNHDREDDNIDTIRKRFKVYKESTLPVIEYYKAKGKVRKIDAAKPVNEVFEAVKTLFTQSDGKVKQRCDGLDKVNIPCYAWKMIFRRSIV